MGNRRNRKKTLREKKERAMVEGHECPKRKERITADVCIVEQTRNGQSCVKCEQYRESR